MSQGTVFSCRAQPGTRTLSLAYAPGIAETADWRCGVKPRRCVDNRIEISVLPRWEVNSADNHCSHKCDPKWSCAPASRVAPYLTTLRLFAKALRSSPTSSSISAKRTSAAFARLLNSIM